MILGYIQTGGRVYKRKDCAQMHGNPGQDIPINEWCSIVPLALGLWQGDSWGVYPNDHPDLRRFQVAIGTLGVLFFALCNPPRIQRVHEYERRYVFFFAPTSIDNWTIDLTLNIYPDATCFETVKLVTKSMELFLVCIWSSMTASLSLSTKSMGKGRDEEVAQGRVVLEMLLTITLQQTSSLEVQEAIDALFKTLLDWIETYQGKRIQM